MDDFTRRSLLQGGTALATAGALTGLRCSNLQKPGRKPRRGRLSRAPSSR